MSKEQSAPKLTIKQETFVAEYLVDLNATQAAIRAGYSAKTANEQGSRLLANVSVQKLIQERMNQRSERLEITSDYVLNTIVDTIERCRQAKPVFDRKGDPVLVETPEGELAQAYVFDSGAVLKGSELLGRHLKLFTEKMEHTGKDGKDLPQSAPILNLTLNK
jgi:phage terminase small subunit